MSDWWGEFDEWWGKFDEEILGCLRGQPPMTPGEVGERLGVSREAATSLLCMLAREGKVRICLVAASDSAVVPVGPALAAAA